jgi:hypothetical protein
MTCLSVSEAALSFPRNTKWHADIMQDSVFLVIHNIISHLPAALINGLANKHSAISNHPTSTEITRKHNDKK